MIMTVSQMFADNWHYVCARWCADPPSESKHATPGFRVVPLKGELPPGLLRDFEQGPPEELFQQLGIEARLPEELGLR